MNMEKEFFVNDGCNFYGMEIQTNDLNPGILNPNWDNSMDQSDLFESTLSSIVSSPVTSHGGGDNVMMRELIGRLGSICNSGGISPHSYVGNSTNTSCYNTPLNSPPKLNLSVMDSQIRGNFLLSHPNSAQFSADPGFAERAARFSCFGSRNLGSLNGKSGSMPGAGAGIGSQMESNKSSMHLLGNLTPNKKLNRLSRSSTPENAGDSREGSSVSEQITTGKLGLKRKSEANTRKRKSTHAGEAKDIKAAAENHDSNGKKIKSEEVAKKDMNAIKGKAEAKDGRKTNDNSKPPEPPKDYIHVRARRGQATDSHSLAERVRREKISKRMKFLQDLVPGCNKVTGKAVMLDEIINYVQSLQRQVEFLSMKLATVNPRMETMLPKDMFKSSGPLPHGLYPLDSTFPYEYQSMPPLHHSISNGSEKQFAESDLMSGQVSNEVAVEVSKFWEDELHSVVQMGYGQNQLQNLYGSAAADEMKSEL